MKYEILINNMSYEINQKQEINIYANLINNQTIKNYIDNFAHVVIKKYNVDNKTIWESLEYNNNYDVELLFDNSKNRQELYFKCKDLNITDWCYIQTATKNELFNVDMTKLNKPVLYSFTTNSNGTTIIHNLKINNYVVLTRHSLAEYHLKGSLIRCI